MPSVISVENLSKTYRLGQIGTGTLTDDLRLWWARLRGRPNPLLKVGQADHGNRAGEEIWALKDVSFTVGQGEVLGIIGRNGAGKSTLLKILSRVTAPTAGQVKVKGRIASLLEVGTGFHPDLTGRENVYLNGAILGMTKEEVQRKFDEIVAFSEVEKFIDTPVKRYSSGMYVRLAFAVAAHLDPEILVVDEVLAVGDQDFQKKCLGKMGDVAREGRTVLFVSHNMAAIRKLCSRSILLEKGVKRLEGDTSTVVDHYLQNQVMKQDAFIRLPDQDNAYGKGISLTTKDLAGGLRTHFYLGEKWVVMLEFELHKRLSHVIAGIGISMKDNLGLVTFWSQPADLGPGRYAVDFLCDIPVKSCDLNVAVGLSENERTFYYFENQARISVEEVARETQPYRSKGSGILLGSNDAIIREIERARSTEFSKRKTIDAREI